jgi:hypothetical protein
VNELREVHGRERVEQSENEGNEQEYNELREVMKLTNEVKCKEV